MKRKCRWNSLWLLSLIPLGLILTILARRFPDACERLYSRGLYPILSQGIGTLFRWLPCSAAELLVIAAVLAALFCLALLFWRLLFPVRKSRRELLALAGRWICAAVSCTYFLFVLLCGLNYNRYPFTYYSGLTIQPRSAAELELLCTDLADRAAALALETPRNPDGTIARTDSFRQTAQKTAQAFSELAERYPVLGGSYSAPKPVFFSKAMSYAQITGVFFPFTYEPNVNRDIPFCELPLTMAHEMTHLRGFMREDEANFIGYLACMESEDADIRYSGTLMALLYAGNQLYAVDTEAYWRVCQHYNAFLVSDFQAINAFWAQYQTPIGEISDQINDAYLKANDQQDGVRSYGRMVDLLLAQYFQEKELS